MLKKPPEEPVNQQQSGNRIKLPEESGIRSVTGFKEFLAMAESSKGSQIELSWKTKVPGQRFVLDMQWDSNQKAPFWTLYEENNGKSQRLWDEPFTIANVDMCYDILVMTCGGVDPTTKNLADILKSQPDKIDWGKSTINKPTNSQAAQGSEGSANASGAGQANNLPETAGSNVVPNNSFPPNMNQNPGFPPGYIFPPGMGMPVSPGTGFAYNVPSNAAINSAMVPNGSMPAPIYPPDLNTANPGFLAQPATPANIWQYGSGGANFYSQPNMANPAVQSAIVQSMPVTSLPAQETLGNLPVDAALFNKQSDISLVDLLVKAELMTETSLAAALKMQELISEGKINWDKAAEVLKHQHNKGENISNYINASAPSVSGMSEGEQNENAAAFELLTQAGLLSKEDIELAQSVIKKHGGDLATVLQAAQKLDAKTLEAAKICCSLQTDGLMKLEQSVILLNYCSRSRVSFDEALSELEWPNPRKQTAQ